MHPLHNRRYNRSHHEGQSLYVATLLSVLAGLLTLYVLLRLYPKPPAPTPVPSTLAPTNHTTWEWKTSSGDGLSGSDIDEDTTTQAPQGTVYNPPPRRRRSITPSDDPDAPQRNDSDPCLRQFDGVQITHINGTKRMYSVPLHTLYTDDLWLKQASKWEHNHKYACDGPIRGKPSWPKGDVWGSRLTGCEDKRTLLWDTTDLAYERSDDTSLLLEGGGLSMEGTNVILTLTSVGAHRYHNPLCPSDPNVLYLTVGVTRWGAWDPATVVKVIILPASNLPTPPVTYTEEGVTIFNVESANDIPTHDIFAQATGLSDSNQWLAWLVGTVRLQGLSDCVACAAARPSLTTFPVYLNNTSDPRGTYCMLRLFMEPHPKACTLLDKLFPPGLNETIPPTFKAQPGPYWCFTRAGSNSVGDLPAKWCHHTYNVNGWANMTEIPHGRMDLYWLCTPDVLRLRLPRHWSGTCTIVRLTAPVTVFVRSSNATGHTTDKRTRREADYSANFDLTQNSPCYIDAIGIPRGVPNEYKLADQIGAGFENIPLLSALFPITPNKNVDRINYIHYNVQRLANLTRDAVEGISTQLAATSLMAFQNRVALDMLLAEKGGVCAMFGEQCCTFIPNNTAPDGSVTKALNGLRALSTEMKEASGMDNPVEAWMRGMFGKWKALAMAIFTSIACFLAILITCGCCCIPCATDSLPALSQENAARHYEHQMIAILARAMPPAGTEDDQSSDYGDEEPYGVY